MKKFHSYVSQPFVLRAFDPGNTENLSDLACPDFQVFTTLGPFSVILARQERRNGPRDRKVRRIEFGASFASEAIALANLPRSQNTNNDGGRLF